MELLYDYRAIRRGLWNYFVIIVPGDAGLMALLCDYRAGRLGLWNQFTIIVPGDRASGTTLRLSCRETELMASPSGSYDVRTAIYSKLLIFILIHFLNIAYTTGFIMY